MQMHPDEPWQFCHRRPLQQAYQECALARRALSPMKPPLSLRQDRQQQSRCVRTHDQCRVMRHIPKALILQERQHHRLPPQMPCQLHMRGE